MCYLKGCGSIRGLKDIRTHAGRGDQVCEPYRAFLRIGSLEMEKARRGKERQSAMLRVNNIDARFQEIEAEKGVLFQIVDQRSAPNGIDAPAKETKLTPHPNRGGFRIKY